jgi:hypothetical protein
MRQKTKIKLFKYIFDVFPTILYVWALTNYWQVEAKTTALCGFTANFTIGVLIFINIAYYITSESVPEIIFSLPLRLFCTIFIFSKMNGVSNFNKITMIYLVYNICITIIHILISLYRGCYSIYILYKKIDRLIRLNNIAEQFSLLEDIITPIKYEGHINDECVICLQDFIMNEKLSQLSCKHFFHPTCCAQWLQINHTCPLCRRSTLHSDELINDFQSTLNERYPTLRELENM